MARLSVKLLLLAPGVAVWRRDHTYVYDGRTVEVHEEWLLHRIDRFTPAPARLSDYEARTTLGFHWWRAADLITSTETIYPPQLGRLLTDVLTNGVPAEPITIGE